ncbi:MAG: cupin domain-containing protein [Betaproteobacteria bacterium]|nr:cupin domain-containing protein [Betaproteobacteria bacterium]
MQSEGRVRRVVTGHDAEGRSIVVSDGPAPAVHTTPLRPGHHSTDIWRTFAAPAPVGDEPDPTPGPRQILPPKNGTVIRIADIAPETDVIRNIDPAHAQELFKAMGSEQASTFGAGSRHPLMHRTETIDYAVVLAGEIYLVLDDAEVRLAAGDVVIQRGTNHAWSNRSKQPARMLYILIDARFDPGLAAKLAAR